MRGRRPINRRAWPLTRDLQYQLFHLFHPMLHSRKVSETLLRREVLFVVNG